MTTIISAVPANLVVDANAVVADANAVVFHDIATVTPPSSQPAVSLCDELDAITAAKDNWEATVYRTSNDQLYAVLQRCYALYKQICSDSAKTKQHVEELDQYLKAKGYGVATSTHTLNKVVRAVFGVDRRRVSAYAIALRAALDAKVAVDGIPQYIRNSGGVEQLRLPKSPNAKTPSQRASEAKHIIDQHVLAQLTLSALSSKLDAAKVGTQHVLIVTQGAGLTFDINAILSSDTVVNTALAAFYIQNKAEAAAADKRDKQARDDSAQQAHIDAAAQSVLQ